MVHQKSQTSPSFCRHRFRFLLILCFLVIYVLPLVATKSQKKATKEEEKVHLIHADELTYDLYGAIPGAQIVKGKVEFRHKGSTLKCDSAYFFQESNSVQAFGHVFFSQKGMSLKCDFADYDGTQEVMRARKNVVLRHEKQILHTDSLDFDRLYNNVYFFEGGTLIQGKDRLVSDWGEYNTETRKAVFYYNVKLKSANQLVKTDTLYYDTQTKLAHVKGPSTITKDESIIETTDAYINNETKKSQLFGRSTVKDKQKTIVGDSLFYDSQTGMNNAYGNVVYVDNENKNSMLGDYFEYNEKTGYGFATKNAEVIDFSQKDTLYMHADTIKLYSYNLGTDSAYRVLHAYPNVRTYRSDIQAVCDSMVFSSKDSCLTMYQNPVIWNQGNQLLGEKIQVFFNDSTMREAHIMGQALSIEKIDEEDHFNQMSSKIMHVYFSNGNVQRFIAESNVTTIYYPKNEQDSSLVLMNYAETDTMKMFYNEDKTLKRIWSSKIEGTSYPVFQIPMDKMKLSTFVWHENIRPISKEDIFSDKKRKKDQLLKYVPRREAPLQHLNNKPPKERQEEKET